jgi:hypothetical protein
MLTLTWDVIKADPVDRARVVVLNPGHAHTLS